jgi:hypothetical protein
MELEGEHEPTGRFRWVLSSTEPLVAGFNASDILPAHGAEEFNLTYQAEPAEIMMHTNMTVSGWEDVGDLVAKGRITVTHGEEEASHAFLGMGSSSSSELCSIFRFAESTGCVFLKHCLCFRFSFRRNLVPLFVSQKALAVSS